VAPLEPASFFSARGLAVLRSELVWVWLPALGFAAAALALGRRRARGALAVLATSALLALLPESARSAGCDDAPYPLRESNPLLQQSLERALRGAGLGEALDSRRLTVSLADLTRPGQIDYAGIHDDHMLYAASLPKIAILVTLFDAVDRGVLAWNDAFRWRLQKMINISDNAQATWAAEQVGLPAIAAAMRDPRWCFYEDGVGGLWAGRAFAKGGPSLREPLRNLAHASTARQAARFFVMLERGALVSPAWSRYMRHLMAPPEYHHKFVAALAGRRGLEFLARKSGTWATFHSDGALVQHGHTRYVLAALSDHADGEAMLRRVAALADDLIREGSHRALGAGAPWGGTR
jgi:beta-lactamase class A